MASGPLCLVLQVSAGGAVTVKLSSIDTLGRVIVYECNFIQLSVK